MCTSEEHLALISNSNAMTDNQWKQWYQYQLSIRVNGFAWDDALEGSRIVASKDEQVGFLKTRIRIEQSAQRPVTPQFPTPVFCGDTHGFAFTEDACTTDASTRLAEEAKYAAMAEHAAKQADAEKTDPKAVGGALKKAFTAIAEPAAEAGEEEGPQKKKKKRGQKKKKNATIGCLDGLKAGSFVAVCFKFQTADERKRRRWYSAQVTGLSAGFAADDEVPHLDDGSFTVVWHPELDDPVYEEWDAAVAEASAAAEEEDGGGGDDDSEVQNEVNSSLFRKDVRLLFFY